MASKVYFIESTIKDGWQAISEKARKLFKAGNFARRFQENDITAVKVHVGQDNNNTYIPALCIKGLVEELIALKTKPFLTDTTTLYAGRRRNAIDHMILATEHGFCLKELGLPFIVADGILGTSESVIQVNGEVDTEVYIASDIPRCQSMLSVAHFTGHIATCMGATIKTLGMGCASKKGKLKQHAALKLSVGDKCTRCGLCVKSCPADAITLDEAQAHIDRHKCIGCAECVAVCRFDAIKCSWGQETEIMQKRMAEHALGALQGKRDKACFFNFVMSITKDCDCYDTPNMPKITQDIGILASNDPVAVDKAALDMVEQEAGKKLQELLKNNKLNPLYQLEHAERIGLGSCDYELVEVKL